MSKRTTVGAGIGLGVIMAVPATAQAEDITVTNLNDSGSGSLRQAIEDANADSDADRILFKSKLSGEISLQESLDLISEPVEIVGPGARRVSVNGNDARILLVATDPGEDVSIAGLTLTNGHARPLFSSGGAIGANDADLTLSKMTIRGNTADLVGGGISMYGGSLTIDSSTISGNTAEGDNGGGGIYASGANDLTIVNSTISGNTAPSADGGGVYVSDDGIATAIRHSTITGNSAYDNGGGLYYFPDEPVELVATIIANNEAADGPDLFGELVDPSFNLIEDPTDSEITTSGGNIVGVDPALKPLKDNGGATDTHAFKKSPAKNKIPKGQSETKDQRGAKRKGKGDIGAYELVKCEGVIVNRVGTGKKDKLKGTKRKDGILGLGGNDKLSGKKGKDGLCGGRGKDKLKGGPGKDKLDGGPGKDKEIQ